MASTLFNDNHPRNIAWWLDSFFEFNERIRWLSLCLSPSECHSFHFSSISQETCSTKHVCYIESEVCVTRRQKDLPHGESSRLGGSIARELHSPVHKTEVSSHPSSWLLSLISAELSVYLLYSFHLVAANRKWKTSLGLHNGSLLIHCTYKYSWFHHR